MIIDILFKKDRNYNETKCHAFAYASLVATHYQRKMDFSEETMQGIHRETLTEDGSPPSEDIRFVKLNFLSYFDI
ncbi:hypothetical protein T06_5563 [Trichinella sp. T6]|nr:hypothetical protein T06_5563 [Trichinella sp. T6]